jgi:hypothetical protein
MRNRVLFASCLLTLAMQAGAGYVNGVWTTEPGSSPPEHGNADVTPPPAGAVIIDFDDPPAPCGFVETGPLTTQYAAQGVVFSGVSPNGGAVLNECGNFSVTGHSSPNFLAFNTNPFGHLLNGGSPVGPEFIQFTQPVRFVQINAGHSEAGLMTLQCSNEAGIVGTSVLIGTAALATLRVSGSRITTCTLSFTGAILVADDLAFAPDLPPIPTLGDVALLGLLSALLAAGVVLSGRR